MNFKFLIISIVITSSLVGSAFAQQEFSQEEIDEMKNKGVLITTNGGTFLIELFPEDAPNTVHNFLKLAESGFYDGTVFHRIIPGFMIQGGDPNTKNPDKSMWGQGGPDYNIKEEFNTLQHDRGIVSMARSQHVDSAGSQFFIVHKDSNHLDGEYTAFGRLVPGLPNALNHIAALETDDNNAPLNVLEATILTTEILDPYARADFLPPDRNQSQIKKEQRFAGVTEVYINRVHDVKFDLPYRWTITEATGKQFAVIIEPNTKLEHNVKEQIERSGFIPKRGKVIQFYDGIEANISSKITKFYN